MQEPIPQRTSRFYEFGPFRFYLTGRELYQGAERVALPPKAVDTLALLLSRHGRLVDKDELMKVVWPDTFVEESNLVFQISQLRKTLGESPDDKPYIETIPRRGYRFAAVVTESWEEVATEPRVAGAVQGQPLAELGGPRRRVFTFFSTAPWVLLVVALGIIATMWWRWPAPSETVPVRRFSFTPDEYFTAPVISPNGKHIVYVTAPGAQAKLWVLDLDRGEPRELGTSGGATRPFWSPDSQFIGFADLNGLKKVPVVGGRVVTLCPMSGISRGTWSPDGGTILFSAGTPMKIYEVPARGGRPEVFLEAEAGQGLTFSRPCFVPRETGPPGLAFVVGLVGYRFFGGPLRRIMLWNPETGEQQNLVGPTAGWPVYSPTGHIVFESTGLAGYSVWGVAVSLDEWKAGGEAFPIAENASWPSVANDGTLAYRDWTVSGHEEAVWRDRSGKRLNAVQLPAYTDTERTQALSPGGSFIAACVVGDIWIYDVERAVWNRFTSLPGNETAPVWSPNGEEIIYTYERGGQSDIYIQRMSGDSEPEPMLATTAYESVSDWSRDGRYLLYEVYHPENGWDLWYLEWKADGSGYETHPFLETPFNEDAGTFSRDGSFVTYCSNESGQPEVYIQSFPGGGEKWRVSRNGGTQPSWSRDGKEIFYMEDDTLMAVSIATGPDFKLGSGTRLFQHRRRVFFDSSFAATATRRDYEVSEDGRQFLMFESAEGEPTRKPSIRVVQNWFEESRNRQKPER